MTNASTASLADDAFAAARISSAQAATLRTSRMLNEAPAIVRAHYVPTVHEVMSRSEEQAMYARVDASRARLARLLDTVH